MTEAPVCEGYSGQRRQSLADGVRLAGGRCGVLGIVVLAAAAMARSQSGNGGRGTLAMAGSGPVLAGIRCCLTLPLGLRMYGTRHTCPCRHYPRSSPGLTDTKS
jgi:hypothetical protein